MASSDRPYYLILLAVVVVVPLVFWPGLVGVFSLAKLLVLQMLVAVALIYAGVTAGRPRSWARIDLLLLVFVALTAVSTAVSANRSTAVFGYYGRHEGLLTYVSYFLVWSFATRITWSISRYRALFTSLAAGATVIAAYGLLQSAGFDPINWAQIRFESGRAFSTLGNPILLASYLAMILPVSAVLALGSDPRHRRLGRVSFVVILAALAMTMTRAGWIAGIVGLGIFLALRHDWKRLSVVTATVVIALVLTATVFASLVPGNQFTQAIKARRSGIHERVEIWRIGVRAAAARPLLGVGPDNFRVAFSPLDTAPRSALVQGDKLIDNAHNYPLQLAVTLGIPAALVLLLWVGWLVSSALEQERSGEEEPYRQALIAAVAAYLVSLLFTVDAIGSGVVFWALLGIMRGGSLPAAVSAGKKTNAVRVARAVPAVGLAICLIALSAIQAAGDSTYLAAKRANQAGRNEEALVLFERAVKINPWVGQYRLDYGLLSLNKADYSNERADYQRSVDIFQEEVERNPLSADGWMLLGQANMYYGRAYDTAHLRTALDNLERALELWPHGAANHYLLGETYLALGDRAQAITWLKKAIHIKSDFPEAREALDSARQTS